MKAYTVFIRADEGNSAVVTAPTAGKAKALALKTTTRRKITELGARRLPELDTDDDRIGPYTGFECLDGYDCSYWGVPVRLP